MKSSLSGRWQSLKRSWFTAADSLVPFFAVNVHGRSAAFFFPFLLLPHNKQAKNGKLRASSNSKVLPTDSHP